MYTAKITNKKIVNGVLNVMVEFTDGVDTVNETCVPQNEDGLLFWVKSRLETFNSAKEIDATYAKDEVLDVSESVVTPPAPTADQIARDKWLNDYRQWVRVKSTLIDTGVILNTNPKAVALLQKVKDNLKAEYLDFI